MGRTVVSPPCHTKVTMSWESSRIAAEIVRASTSNDMVWSGPTSQSWQYAQRRLQRRVAFMTRVTAPMASVAPFDGGEDRLLLVADETCRAQANPVDRIHRAEQQVGQHGTVLGGEPLGKRVETGAETSSHDLETL